MTLKDLKVGDWFLGEVEAQLVKIGVMEISPSGKYIALLNMSDDKTYWISTDSDELVVIEVLE